MEVVEDLEDAILPAKLQRRRKNGAFRIGLGYCGNAGVAVDVAMPIEGFGLAACQGEREERKKSSDFELAESH